MDDTNMQGMRDASRVDLNDPYELAHWTKRFNITEAKLREVVAKVGIMVDDVVKELEPGGYRP